MTDITISGTVSHDYAGLVEQFLTLGDPGGYDPAKWIDYPARFGFTSAHVPALIQMACDMALHYGDGMSSVVWAPVHAWRTLGQLRAEDAIEPLLASMRSLWESEAPIEDLSHILAMIGPAAIPSIAALLTDLTIHSSPACIAMSGLTEIVKRHPERRDECVAILIRTLERATETKPETNGWAVGALLDLHAVEAIETIREAFRLDLVDPSMAGDLEDVEVELGLRKKRATPRPLFWHGDSDDWIGVDESPVTGGLSFEEDFRPRKIGRNEPCPCGSGRKYKKCCLV